MPWIVDVVEDYLDNVRPRYDLGDHPALWLTERGGRVTPRHIQQRFADYRTALNMGGSPQSVDILNTGS